MAEVSQAIWGTLGTLVAVKVATTLGLGIPKVVMCTHALFGHFLEVSQPHRATILGRSWCW